METLEHHAVGDAEPIRYVLQVDPHQQKSLRVAVHFDEESPAEERATVLQVLRNKLWQRIGE